ncbi:MAG: hypothetical protein ACT4NV_12560 [Rhodoferax sp.]
MNLSLGLWIVVAVLAAWAVGAHSRFKRLRSLGRQARESLARHLDQVEQRAAPLALWAQAQGTDAPALGQTQVWLLEVRSVVERASALRQRLQGQGPHPGTDGSGLGRQLLAVLERCPGDPTDLPGDVLPAPLLESLLSALRDAQLRLARYNTCVQEWNVAVQQAPASWLARVAGMRQEPLL